MNQNLLVLAAAMGGLIVGVAGTKVFAPATPGVACAASDVAAEAKADAVARQLHAHDHDTYVPKPAPPVGELPKPADASSTNAH
ncbi:hypothetical protein [Rudaea sp.]|uniref:hypothetical protein n=1 Tax=Rudaea sp. TaxID=2136325 RepID=UPI0037843687